MRHLSVIPQTAGNKGGGRKRVTLSEVAAKAGVSIATASVAVTGRPSGNCRVSPAVAERVRAVAREMAYRPNVQARNLATRRTRTVAFLIKRAAWHNAMFYVSAMQRLLRQNGYMEQFMLHPDNSLSGEREQLETCLARRVEGIIIMPLLGAGEEPGCNAATLNQLVRDEGIAVVQLGIALPDCIAPAVVHDDTGGFRDAVKLLHAMGHERIAHATVPCYDDASPLNPYRQAHLRYTGYAASVRELGLREIVLHHGGTCGDVENLYEDGIEIGQQLATAAPAQRPTAVTCMSDHLAAGVMGGLADGGVDVPGEVSVLGLGDLPFARMLRPPLSTIAPQFDRMAEQATQTLLRLMEANARGVAPDAPPAPLTPVPVQLATRQSVRAPCR
jgi:DNA-binding LacI/PurR family transcriptional regulator